MKNEGVTDSNLVWITRYCYVVGFIEIAIVVIPMEIAYWGVYQWVFGRKNIQTMSSPLPPDMMAPTASAHPTGTGVGESSHPSTESMVNKEEEAERIPPLTRETMPDDAYLA